MVVLAKEMSAGFAHRATPVYDGSGGLTSNVDPICPSTTFVFERRDSRPVPPYLTPPLKTCQPAQESLLSRTLEFRLSGSEEDAICIPFTSAEGLAATANNLRVYVGRNGAPAAGNVIAGVDVRTELRPTGVACLARLTDFGALELVVVQVDLAVYRAREGEGRSSREQE